jgi:hypothetical protein
VLTTCEIKYYLTDENRIWSGEMASSLTRLVSAVAGCNEDRTQAIQ